jgi:YVTN family beta-propeller protein
MLEVMSPGLSAHRIAPLPARLALVILGAASLLPGCGGDDPGPLPHLEFESYSASIQPIFDRSCLVGCHSTVDAPRSNDLDLSSWEATFRGSDHGEIIVPFLPDDSHMIDHLTGVATPRMPLSRDPLPSNEIDLLKEWITLGAPNDAGDVPYENSTRKIYVANQGSDEVSVIDLDALVVFRIVTVGVSPNLEGPHNIWIESGPLKRYWYVTLINSGVLEQYDARTDELVARATLGASPANGVTSSDGSRVYVTRWEETADRLGKVIVVEAASMSVIDTIEVGWRPHGIAISPDDHWLYTTNYNSDDISVVDLTLPEPAEVSRIPVAPDLDPLRPAQYQPNEVILSPDGTQLFVALFVRPEMRVIDLVADSLLTVVTTGGTGFLEDLRPGATELYVADWGKPGGGPGTSISIVNTASFGPATILQDPNFSRPHGIAFSPDGRYAFVTNENVDGTAPPHHPTEGGGNNGNLVVIDTATRGIVKILDLEPQSAGIAVLH